MALLTSTTPIAIILGADEPPLETNVVEVIGDFLVFVYRKRNFLLAWGFAGLESIGRRADFGAEINLGGMKNLIEAEPRILLNYKFGLGRNRAEKVDENGREEGDDFGREKFVGNGTDEHHGGGEGGVGGEDGGGGLRNRHFFEINHDGRRRRRWGMTMRN